MTTFTDIISSAFIPKSAKSYIPIYTPSYRLLRNENFTFLKNVTNREKLFDIRDYSTHLNGRERFFPK